MEAHEIIIRPLLTEKSYAGIQGKVYTFVVNKKAVVILKDSSKTIGFFDSLS